MSTAEIERALVVEDHPKLAQAVTIALEDWIDDVREVHDVDGASNVLNGWSPQLILLDVSLPDGTAFDVLERVAELEPFPIVIAMSGTATPQDSFRLAELGVRCYLQKPINLELLQQSVTTATEKIPDFRHGLVATVGVLPLRDVEGEVRKTIVMEALARSSGSRRKAAGLLSISRQLLQHILRGWR